MTGDRTILKFLIFLGELNLNQISSEWYHPTIYFLNHIVHPTKRIVVFGSNDGVFVLIFTTPFKAEEP